MKKILFIGHSPAAVRAIETLRRSGIDAELTMLSTDVQYPYITSKIPLFLGKQINGKELFYREKRFFEEHHVNLILDQKISRINLGRRKVHTEQKQKFDFDLLVFSQLPHLKKPDVKGKQREGIYSLRDIRDLQTIHKELPLVENVVIQSSKISGFLTALVLRQRGKDVTLITTESFLLPEIFSEELHTRFLKFLQEQGVAVYCDNDIAEFLGETELKAVRLQSGKVLACDIALLGELPFDTRLLDDSELVKQKALVVDRESRTNLSGVFAVDMIATPSAGRDFSHDFQPLSFKEAEGDRLASVLIQELGINVPSDPVFSAGPVKENYRFDFDAWTMTVSGDLMADGDRTSVSEHDGRLMIRKIFQRNKVIRGGFLLNDPEADRIAAFVHDQAELTQPLEEELFGKLSQTGIHDTSTRFPKAQGSDTDESSEVQHATDPSTVIHETS